MGPGPAFSPALEAWLHPRASRLPAGARLCISDDKTGQRLWLTPEQTALAREQQALLREEQTRALLERERESRATLERDLRAGRREPPSE